MTFDTKERIEGHLGVVRDPQERIAELLAANVRFEQRARDAERAYAELQMIAEAATTNRYRSEGAHITNTSLAVRDVLNERGKHASYGFDDKHDDERKQGEIVCAAIVYALDAIEKLKFPAKWAASFGRAIEPWPMAFARTARTNLVYAAAMLIAELDRQDRAAMKKVTP